MSEHCQRVAIGTKLKSCLTAFVLVATAVTASCTALSQPKPDSASQQKPSEVAGTKPPVAEPGSLEPATIPAAEPPQPKTSSSWIQPPPEDTGYFETAGWDDLPGWNSDDFREAWPAFIRSCMALKSQPLWQPPCLAASRVERHDNASLRTFFETWFNPFRVFNSDGSASGMVTGYYEPLLHGSRTRTDKYRYPLYGVPDDLLTIDVDTLFPELIGERVRGRRVDGHVVPYFTRAEIENGIESLRNREIAWVDDQVELFFLHIQGSGRIQLDNGDIMRVGYANHNGHPYRSVGRILIDRGELTSSNASMQGIKDWANANPGRLDALLAENPGFVFFRELPAGPDGPIGALGVPITPRRSIAIDEQSVPLGAPVFLATTWPNSSKPLSRLMLAQDIGGAIKGAVRADFFWGFGDEAAELAGRMRQSGTMWVLFPKSAHTSARRSNLQTRNAR
jgi:membrane-bound lytic murein transglycosylase A